MGANILAIDLGGTNCRVAIVNEDLLSSTFELEDYFKFKTPKNPEKFIELFQENLAESLSDKSFDQVSIAAPGIWDEKRLLKQSINLPKYIDYPLWERLFPQTKEISLIKDVDAAVIGEAVYALNNKYESVLYINIGTGFSGALYKDKKLFTTSYSPTLRLDYLMDTNIDNGGLSKTISNLALILSPQVIAIGGGKAVNDWDALVQPAIEESKAYLKGKLSYDLEIQEAKNRNAGLYGALYLAKSK